MLPQGSYENKTVVVDHQQKLITSQGPATAIAFALAIVSQIQGERTAKQGCTRDVIRRSLMSTRFKHRNILKATF